MFKWARIRARTHKSYSQLEWEDSETRGSDRNWLSAKNELHDKRNEHVCLLKTVGIFIFYASNTVNSFAIFPDFQIAFLFGVTKSVPSLINVLSFRFVVASFCSFSNGKWKTQRRQPMRVPFHRNRFNFFGLHFVLVVSNTIFCSLFLSIYEISFDRQTDEQMLDSFDDFSVFFADWTHRSKCNVLHAANNSIENSLIVVCLLSFVHCCVVLSFMSLSLPIFVDRMDFHYFFLSFHNERAIFSSRFFVFFLLSR